MFIGTSNMFKYYALKTLVYGRIIKESQRGTITVNMERVGYNTDIVIRRTTQLYMRWVANTESSVMSSEDGRGGEQ